LNLCKTILANPNGLPWKKKIKMREYEILSKYYSKNLSSEKGM